MLTFTKLSDREQILLIPVKITGEHRNHHKPLNQRVLCIDGEGYDSDNGHIYNYMAASNADATVVDEISSVSRLGLSSQESFYFLCNLPASYLKVGFSFSYDINMMLKDLPIRYLQYLWEHQYVRWKGWHIAWTPSKVFTVARKTKNHNISCTVWDMFGFFQQSLIKALWEWNIGNLDELKLIDAMKLKRNSFDQSQLEDIKYYCKLECKLGAQLYEKALDCTKNVGLKLARYDGAGAIASSILRKHSVQSYMHPKERIPDEVILSGYIGGRFDLTRYGEQGDCWQYDINSAYPTQLMSLPCLSCANIQSVQEWDEHRPGIYRVTWDLPESALWAPFPYRVGHHIKYLRNGLGWYWSDEVSAAIRLYPGYVQAYNGYAIDRGCSHQPFRFVQEYYNRRQELKANGDLGQKILKLGINALYGKLAQNVGRHEPKNQCFLWAGMVTSATRARLLRAIQSCPDAILVATDGIVTPREIECDVGDGLGEWSRNYLQDLFIIGNGIYTARGIKEVKEATRGVSSKDFYDGDKSINHWESIRKLATARESFTYPLSSRRFHGLGYALSEKEPLASWRQWSLDQHEISYGRFTDKEFRNGRLYPAMNPTPDVLSAPFNPKVFRVDEGILIESLCENPLQDVEPSIINP